jgi:hypothetical protein
MAAQVYELGSREGQWAHGYVKPFSFRPIEMFIASAIVAWAAIVVAERHLHHREWLTVFGWFAVGMGLQALFRLEAPFTFEHIFASDAANSFYTVARHTSATAMLSEFLDIRMLWPVHAHSNMPGKLILVDMLLNLSERPGVLAWLVVAISNLGGVLTYVFVRDLFGDRRMALYAMVLYFFVPGKILFFPLLNAVTPVIVLACAWLLLKWLQTERWQYAALFGIALYGLVLFEPLTLVIGLVFAALIVWWLREWRTAWRPYVWQAVSAVVAFAAVHVLMLAVYGFDLFHVFQTLGEDAVKFNVATGRPYGVWVRENLADFLFCMGVCQAVLVIPAIQRAPILPATGTGASDHAGDRRPSAIVVLTLSLLAVLLVVDLVGVNRGETVRLWIFLACMFQIPAAYVCSRNESRVAICLVVGTVLLQISVATWMIGFAA